MGKIIDARGLACPQPVILTKKALEQGDEVTVIVDNAAAVENVKRMGISSGCTVDTEEGRDGTCSLHLTRSGKSAPHMGKDNLPASQQRYGCTEDGPFVVVISSDRMGRGDDDLGFVLIRSFIHTLLTLAPRPDVLIFYNTGVKLALKDSEVLDDLKQLDAAGVTLLVCGTCTNYFGITDELGVGLISNMYDIASALADAGRLIAP